MIEINDITKIYKRRVKKNNKKYEKITALDNINLSIKDEDIIGFIGLNGAGKTTTLKILATIVIPDKGTISIDGFDIIKDANIIKSKVGLLAGEFVRSLYWRLSGRQNLYFFAKLRGIWNPKKRVDELLEIFNLTEMENELVMKYSTGMKHKLAFAAGLLHDPPILLLDEPLTGIDPITCYDIKNLIKNEFKNKTIIWASHNLYEIEEMCDRIALINKGKLILEGIPDKIKKDHWDHSKVIVISDNPSAFKSFKNNIIKNDVVEIITNDLNRTFNQIMELSKKKNIKIYDIKTIKPTLEEIFMEGVKNV
jgi:ABC-2 type transport system ATP-binding protein